MNIYPGKVDNKWKNIHVLVHFFEEEKYSVLLLKETAPINSNFTDEFDFSKWNTEQIVKAVWGNEEYPAYFLKFSENKNDLEEEGEKLAKSFKEKTGQSRHKIHTTKRPKPSVLKEKKTRIESGLMKELQLVNKEEILSKQNNIQKLQIEELKFQLQEKEAKIQRLDEKVRKYKTKYRENKKRLAETSMESSNQIGTLAAPIVEDCVQIGSIIIPKSKHALIRSNNFSRYTGDLMEIVFGSDFLSNCLLKGIKGSKKTDILNPTMVEDIIGHVVGKFNVSVQQVRYAMRMKLNYCHKLKKRGSDNKENE